MFLNEAQQPYLRTEFTYDDADRVTQMVQKHQPYGPSPTILATYGYTYNAASEITQYTGPEGTLNYTYYATSELNTVTGARSETYTYDLNGNRNMTGYVTTAGNRLQSDGTYNYTYDNEGNLLTRTRISDGELTEFTWDHRNRLTKIIRESLLTQTERFSD